MYSDVLYHFPPWLSFPWASAGGQKPSNWYVYKLGNYFPPFTMKCCPGPEAENNPKSWCSLPTYQNDIFMYYDTQNMIAFIPFTICSLDKHAPQSRRKSKWYVFSLREIVYLALRLVGGHCAEHAEGTMWHKTYTTAINCILFKRISRSRHMMRNGALRK